MRLYQSRMVRSIIIAAAGAVALAQPQPAQNLPQFPVSFSVSGQISLPYANLTETFATWVDGVNINQRIEYYNGLDTYIINNASQVMWQVNPEGYQYACFETFGQQGISTFLPDTTNFTYVGQTVINGKNAWQYQMLEPDYQRVNTYDMYVSADGSYTPLWLHFIGYDILLGSHYDEYSFTYEYYNTLPIDPSRFSKPTGPYTCGPFPTPPGHTSPLDLPSELVPQPGWAAATQPGSQAPVPSGDSHAYTRDAGFQSFMATYGRVYANEAEAARRYALYTKNRRLVDLRNRHNNARGSSLRLALNNFADATTEEMMPRYGHRADGSSKRRDAITGMGGEAGYSNGAHATHVASGPKSALPASVDWSIKGAVSPVPDQAICGSCWAHGATGTLEGQLFLATGNMTVLSKQELMDCSWDQGNNACDGGNDWAGYQWIMENGGISARSAYGPYLAQDGFCHANATGLPKALTISSYVNVTSGDENALMDALATVGPISISIDAAVDSFSFYSSGVYDDPACANGLADLDHTVLATGYGTDSVSGLDYWIVRNSWSTHWGNSGFIWIARQGNICGVATDPTYANIQVL